MINIYTQKDFETNFNEIYSRHYQGLFSFFISKVGRREIALDLLQELFLKLWKRMENLNGMAESNQRYWIYRVAQNLVIDYYRKQSVKTETTIENISERLVSDRGNNEPSEIVVKREYFDMVTNAVNDLPEELRTIFCMSTIGNLSSTDIGVSLGIPAGTVRYKIMIARNRIKEMLKMYKEDPDEPIKLFHQ